MFNYCIIGILVNLLKKQKLTASQLSEKFEISVRTVYRYIEILESAGIPIICKKGKNGGIELIESYSMDANLFSEDEKDYLFDLLKNNTDTLSTKIKKKLNYEK